MRVIFLLVVAGLVAGCQTTTGSTHGMIGAYERTETVRYNKKDYQVSFKYRDTAKAYDVSVKRASRPMTSGAEDRNNAQQVAISTVSYYACPKGYRAKVSGVTAYSSERWSVQAQCAKTA